MLPEILRRDNITIYYRCESPAVAKIIAMLSGFSDHAEHESGGLEEVDHIGFFERPQGRTR